MRSRALASALRHRPISGVKGRSFSAALASWTAFSMAAISRLQGELVVDPSFR